MLDQTPTMIYALVDPDTFIRRYIGRTTKSLARKLNQHITDSKRKDNHRSNWIAKLIRESKTPAIELLENCIWSESAKKEQAWIEKNT